MYDGPGQPPFQAPYPPGQHGPQPGQYGPQPEQYGPQPEQYGPQPGQYGPPPGQYGPPPGYAQSPMPVPPPGGQFPGPQKQSRRGKTIAITLVVTVLVCAGLCGVGQLITNIVNQDDWKNLGQPVPSNTLPANPTPTWTPPNMFTNPQPILSIRHELEGRVLESAGVSRPMTSSCDRPDFTGQTAAVFNCTVTYDGQNVVYSISARPKGDRVFEWDGKAKQIVVTREGLLAFMDRNFGAGTDWKELRCEEFPAVALVPVGQKLDAACYARLGKRIKKSRLTIIPNDRGPLYSDTEHQD